MNVHGSFRFPANSSNMENPYLGWFGMVMKNGGSTVAQGGVVSFKVAAAVTDSGYIEFKSGTYSMTGCGGNTISKLARHKVAGWLPTTIAGGATGVVMWCGAASILAQNTVVVSGSILRYGATAGLARPAATTDEFGDGAIFGVSTGYFPLVAAPKIQAFVFPWRV